VAVVVMHDPESDAHRVSLGGLKTGKSGKLVLNNSWLPLDKDAGFIIGRDGDRESDSIIGSETLWPGTGYFTTDVSKQHVSVFFDGNNINVLDTSIGGTKLYKEPSPSAEAVEEDEFGHLSEHTMTAEERARVAQLLRDVNGKKEYSGREPINRNTTDPEGKVDIRAWSGGGEAIVVDSEKEPDAYKELLKKCDTKLREMSGFTEKDLIQVIYDTVSETMKYDLEFANKTAESLLAKSKKINLSAYLEEGKGVCRHMALSCQWLGARLAEKYTALLEGGEFTVPVNQRERDNAAHEWVRYTSPKGKVYIIDVAQGFVGTLEEVVQDTDRGVERWEYFTDSEEKKRYEKFLLGDTAVRASSSFFRRRKQR